MYSTDGQVCNKAKGAVFKLYTAMQKLKVHFFTSTVTEQLFHQEKISDVNDALLFMIYTYFVYILIFLSLSTQRGTC